MWGAVLLTALCVSGAAGQPSGCKNDAQCSSGFYCEFVSLQCRECRSCDQLQRGPPLVNNACVRSISECGPCFPGLVKDGDEQCVASESGGDGHLSPYVWVAIVLGLLLVALVLGVIVYVLRHVDGFKIRASTRTSVQSAGAGAGAVAGAASAPEMPPPYNAHYTLHDQLDSDNQQDESSRLYTKPTPAVGGAREPAARQAAVVSDAPVYVRLPPPSYDSSRPEEADPEEEFTIHDENTRESLWTPNGNNTTDTENNANFSYLVPTSPPNGTVSSEVATPSHTDLSPPPAKMVCVRQQHESNNNRGEGPETTGAPGPPLAPSFVISVVQNINARPVHERRTHGTFTSV